MQAILSASAPGHTLTWEPSPEDSTVVWTLPVDGCDLYAAVNTVEVFGTSADYDLPHKQTSWAWMVADARTGTEVASGESPREGAARSAAETALREAIAASMGPSD